MALTKGAHEVRLGTVPLEVLYSEDGLIYQEEMVVGAEVAEGEASAQQFVDTFNSWHKGGFMAEHVQDGYYFRARNVDCTNPGEIRPSPKRHGTIDVSGTAGLANYGVAGIAYRTGDELFLFFRYEDAAGDNAATGIQAVTYRLSTLASFTLGLHGTDLDTTASDTVGATGDGFTNIIRSLKVVQGGFIYFLVPLGRRYVLLDSAGINATVAKGAHAFARGFGRYFAVSLESGGEVAISNMDVAAALSAAGNWTAVVRMGSFDRGALEPDPVGLTCISLNGIPYVGTPHGLFVLAQGGFPQNLTPQFAMSPTGRGNLAALIAMSQGGAAGGLFGANRIGVFSPIGQWNLEGPGANPLTKDEETIVMDLHESTSGDLWAYVFFPNRTAATDGSWEIWCGKLQPDRSYAWHQIWTDENPSEGGPLLNTGADNDEKAANAALRPMLPSVANVNGTLFYRFLAGTGHATDVSRLTSFDSRLFYALPPKFENNEVREVGTDYNVTVTWRGGRFSRHDHRTFRHWTALHFLGKNIDTLAGGRVRVEVSYDGGAFQNPAGPAVYLTSNDQMVALDFRCRDIEVQLTWQLDGITGSGDTAMQNAPATVTQIQYEGREVPRALRRISFVCAGAAPAQAGGVRQKKDASNLFDTIEAMNLTGVKQAFLDPYKPTTARQVVVLPPVQLTAGEAHTMKVPEGAVRVTLLEVPS